jgi:hypothetical protein
MPSITLRYAHGAMGPLIRTQTIRNYLAAARIALDLKVRKRPIADITRYERRFSSQNGEDGILEALFTVIPAAAKYFVEFGAGSGGECNSARLAKRGWTGLLMDAVAPPPSAPFPIHQELITAENINALFEKYNVPPAFDLLSIDIDGNDYWVWKSITAYRPQIVVVEYNASVPPTESRVMPYDPNFRWTGTDYFGASLAALAQLGAAKGYVLVGCDTSGTNAFFVDAAKAAGHFAPRSVAELYRPPNYRKVKRHPPDPSRTLMPI